MRSLVSLWTMETGMPLNRPSVTNLCSSFRCIDGLGVTIVRPIGCLPRGRDLSSEMTMDGRWIPPETSDQHASSSLHTQLQTPYAGVAPHRRR